MDFRGRLSHRCNTVSGQAPNRNAFTVLMDSARSGRIGDHGGMRGSGKSGRGGGEYGRKSGHGIKSTSSRSFPHPWQQPLYKVAMRPEDHKDAYPSLQYDELCVLIADCFPKGKHHFLVIARDPSLEQPLSLSSQHCELVEHMKSFAEARIKPLQNDGVDFRLGFHSVPSMRQLHLHVVSTDLSGTGMKQKKHWNSFTTDFFVGVDEVIATLRHGGQVLIDRADCEELLKLPLNCNKCRTQFGTMPKLKSHIVQCNTDAATNRNKEYFSVE